MRVWKRSVLWKARSHGRSNAFTFLASDNFFTLIFSSLPSSIKILLLSKTCSPSHPPTPPS